MEMESPELEIVDREGFLEVRALGTYALDRLKGQLDRAVEACEARRRDRLLFDITALAGYSPPTVERFEIGSHVASLIRRLERFACLALADQIDRQNFTSKVASNRGMPAPVFSDRNEALDWLRH